MGRIVHGMMPSLDGYVDDAAGQGRRAAGQRQELSMSNGFDGLTSYPAAARDKDGPVPRFRVANLAEEAPAQGEAQVG